MPKSVIIHTSIEPLSAKAIKLLSTHHIEYVTLEKAQDNIEAYAQYKHVVFMQSIFDGGNFGWFEADNPFSLLKDVAKLLQADNKLKLCYLPEDNNVNYASTNVKATLLKAFGLQPTLNEVIPNSNDELIESLGLAVSYVEKLAMNEKLPKSFEKLGISPENQTARWRWIAMLGANATVFGAYYIGFITALSALIATSLFGVGAAVMLFNARRGANEAVPLQPPKPKAPQGNGDRPDELARVMLHQHRPAKRVKQNNELPPARHKLR